MEATMPLNVVDLVDQPDSRHTRAEYQSRSSDPVKYFHLRENPFLDNVNPEFFFRTEAHEDAYLKMKKCIEDHISLGLITARSGTGKTLLTQILLKELGSDKYRPALVLAYPKISRTALLLELASELEIQDLPAKYSLHTLLTRIQEFIYRTHRDGIKPVFLIDEVHFLSGDTLHLLRTLSNIETARQKLATILLFGEESFLEKMKKPGYRAIFSRMFVRAHLRPLLPGEVEQYIKFRCLMAGGRPDMFEEEAYPQIHQATDGVPREVNRLCHNALEMAVNDSLPRVSAAVIRKIVHAG